MERQVHRGKGSLFSEILSALASVIILAAGVFALIRMPAGGHPADYLLAVLFILFGLYGTVRGMIEVRAVLCRQDESPSTPTTH